MQNTATLPALADPLTEERLAYAARILKLIANPSKLAILQHLHLHGPTSVNDLCAAVGLSQPLLSHHLASLKGGGVVQAQRQGKSIYYRLALLEVTSVLECLAHCQPR